MVELAVDGVGNFGVLNFGAGVVLDCAADDEVDVKALTHVPSSAEHSEPGGQPVTRQL